MLSGAPRFLGLEIGGTKLQLVVGDESLRVLQRERLSVEPSRGGAGIRQQIEERLPQLLRAHRVQSVGVGFGGPVDWRTGRIARSHQIAGWSGFDLAGWLQPLVKAPVTAENDANVAALGEALHGAGVGLNPVFYVTLGSGVGGGLVVDGAIYHGLAPGESEIGHVRLDRQGTTLESRCSGWALDARIRELSAKNPRAVLARLSSGSPGGEARHLPTALGQGDSDAAAILRETAEDLAFGLSHVVHLFHPEIIVLGGGLSGLGPPLQTAVSAALERHLMEVFRPGPTIALANLGEDAVPIGALHLAAKQGAA